MFSVCSVNGFFLHFYVDSGTLIHSFSPIHNPWMERLMQLPSLTLTPCAVSAARAIISNAELAADAPESLRRLAYMVAASAHGVMQRQRHRPANTRKDA